MAYIYSNKNQVGTSTFINVAEIAAVEELIIDNTRSSRIYLKNGRDITLRESADEIFQSMLEAEAITEQGAVAVS